ncbi:MAG: hypothetical protein GXO13_05125 [Epsilonproteobacteria bacterium]|nr:hypothetical protein [Campylobacterota bacterium]
MKLGHPTPVEPKPSLLYRIDYSSAIQRHLPPLPPPFYLERDGCKLKFLLCIIFPD